MHCMVDKTFFSNLEAQVLLVSNISCGAILEGESGFVIHFLSFHLPGLRMKSKSRDLVFSSDIVGGEC